jgi:hypothetical protein
MYYTFFNKLTDRNLCSDCPTTSKSGSCGAGVTMFTDHNRQTLRGEFSHLRDMNFISTKILLGGNIEITVKKISLPVNRNRSAAHNRGDGTGVKETG